MARIRVKICGVTRPEDAELAVELGADYLGLNFFPQSPRFLEELRAREIAAAVSGRFVAKIRSVHRGIVGRAPGGAADGPARPAIRP